MRVVKNKSRDILPFIKIMPDVVSAGHDFFVKVHTKKLLHRRDGNEWRKDIYSKLNGHVLNDERCNNHEYYNVSPLFSPL